MEDRFKFRVWCKNKNEWEKNEPFLHSDGTLHCWHPSHLKPYSLETHTIGQCTGLKDKNGMLIYEGDVHEYGGRRYVVTYGEFSDSDLVDIYDVPTLATKGCGWYLKMVRGKSTFHIGAAQKYLTVIGNIHQNPELLEED